MRGFEWHDEKAAANFAKHGIGFNDASRALLGFGLTQPGSGRDENRFTTVCECEGRLIAVIWTPRHNFIRLISARVARKNERTAYYQAVSRAAENRRH